MEVLSQTSSSAVEAPVLVHSLMQDLQRALALEAKFQPRLHLPSATNNGGEAGEITSPMRDGAAHVLRCLKVWYDLPSSVLLSALNLMDRFISRMKARPKHLSCIAISSFHLAAMQWVGRSNSEASASTQSTLQAPEPHDLVMISQCKCTAGDIVRMEKIVESKLACLPNEEPVTTLTFLTLYHSLLTAASAASSARSPLSPPLQVPDLLILSNKLETICCDANYAAFPSSQLALALVFTEVKRHNVLIELQQLLQVRDDQLNECMKMVNSVVTPYDGYAQSNPSHRQRLTWKLSRRTLKQLRPTEKLVSVLPTIEEHRQFGQVTKRGKNRRPNCSGGGGSSGVSASSRPSPRKMMRPVSPASSSSLPLPFPTKEDLASFFEYFVPTPHPYPFRVLFGNHEEESPSPSLA